MLDSADRAGRNLTRGEREVVNEHLSKADRLRREAASNEGVMEFARKMGAPVSSAGGRGGAGAAFVNSAGYKKIADPGARTQSFSSGLVEVAGPFQAKGTLLEGSGSPGSGTGGGLVPSPYVVPGIVDALFQPVTFEQLLMSGQATGNTVRYVVQGTATSAAAGVAEGGVKPESTLGFSTEDEPVKKIATTITLSDEILDDAPAVATFVSGQLTQFIDIEVERQLLRGTSGGNEVQGLLTSRSVPVYAGGTAVGNKAVQLFKAMNGTRGSAFVEPNFLVVHPTDYQDLRLLTDAAGQYFGGGPFQGQYGNGQVNQASGQITGAVDLIWGKPTYVTPIIGAGTALVGTSAAAQVWHRGGVQVEFSNSHSDYFVKDLVAARAERRLALSVFRPSAFCEVRF